MLGRLHPDRFLGGEMKLDLALARAVIAEKIGKPLGMSVEAAAAGIIRIANASMERAIRVSSAEKGYDPRDITLVAFGGAGPMHAAALAQAVGIARVLVPESPGVFSAVGLVMADIRHDFAQTKVLGGNAINADNIAPLFESLAAEGRAALSRDGVPPASQDLQRSADFRYVGQAYEVNVAVPGGPLDAAAVAAAVQGFHDLHQQLYAHHHPTKPVEFVSGRVAAIGLMAAPQLTPSATRGGQAISQETRPVYFDETEGFVDAAIYNRDALGPGDQFAGPAVVEQIDTTTVIHPGQRAAVDDVGNLMITIAP